MPVVTDRHSPITRLHDALTALPAELPAPARDAVACALTVLNALEATDEARFALRTQPTVSVDQYAALLGVDRSTAYDSVKTGIVPSIRVGRRIRVPSEPVRRMLGLDVVEAPAR